MSIPRRNSVKVPLNAQTLILFEPGHAKLPNTDRNCVRFLNNDRLCVLYVQSSYENAMVIIDFYVTFMGAGQSEGGVIRAESH